MTSRLDSGEGSGTVAPESNVLFDTWLASRATVALLDGALAKSGLNADEFAIYSILAVGADLTPTELAQWMSAPATTVSSYIRRFERRGHVQRVPNPDDGRSYRLALTEAGAAAHRRAARLFAPVLDEVSTRLGGDVSDTQRRLQRLHRTLHQVLAEAGLNPGSTG